MNPNQTSLNDDDYQYYEKKPIWKIIFIILGIAVVAAIVYFFFIREPKFNQNDIVEIVDTTAIVKPQPAPVQETEPAETENYAAAGNKYHIIAGAFIVEKNAAAYMEELQKKGYNPQIILKKNEYSFISLFSYPTFKEANNKYKELENQGFPIWIMKYKI